MAQLRPVTAVLPAVLGRGTQLVDRAADLRRELDRGLRPRLQILRDRIVVELFGLVLGLRAELITMHAHKRCCRPLPHKIIGIRSGEKLHETMIPADDAHCTVELEDRFVILQSFANAARDAYLHRGAKPVAEGFSYSSDSNPEKLDVRGLHMLLQMAYA